MPQVNLDTWRPHVLAALQTKQPFARYAREHGVSANMLYVAHRLMKANGEIAPTLARVRQTRSAFVPVHLEPSTGAHLQVVLPNGLVLTFSTVDAALLRCLASLPCLT